MRLETIYRPLTARPVAWRRSVPTVPRINSEAIALSTEASVRPLDGLARRRIPPRAAAAVLIGRMASRASRRLRIGRGAVIGGRVALMVDPRVLERLTAGRSVILVAGTNGKTTTTRLIAEALATRRTVSSTSGANMTAGLVTAAGLPSDELVLEVDELYLPRTIAATRPSTLVLLNLSRDQLDRMTEVRRIADLWRSALDGGLGRCTVVANCDDPMVVWAVGRHPDVVWVAAGHRWRKDSAICPACARVDPEGVARRGTCRCGFSRPCPSWTVSPTEVRGPGGPHRLHLALPGPMNRSNAAVAIAVAAERGVDVPTAVAAVERVASVGGRYHVAQLGSRRVRMLLAKNPASWDETLRLIEGSDTGIVICVNARGPDGRDVSWLWDVPFERLAGRHVVATGERRWDLAVRLRTAGIAPQIEADPLRAVGMCGPSGAAVELVGTYTAFHDVLDRLGVRW